jgi:hypothetical protein
MKIGIDVDGTVLTQANFRSGSGTYHLAQPIPGAVEAVNKLYSEGHTIIFHTARHNLNDILLAKEQLEEFGFRYHHLVAGKPGCDVFIDDRAMTFDGDWSDTMATLQRYQDALSNAGDSFKGTSAVTPLKELSRGRNGRPRIAVVVLSHNQPQDTELLHSQLAGQLEDGSDLYVVECGTRQDSLSSVTTDWLKDESLRESGHRPTNRINAGLRVAKSHGSYDYVWLILSGTKLSSSDTLARMLDVMERSPNIGILQPNPASWSRYTSPPNSVTLYPRLDFCCWLIRDKVLDQLGTEFCDNHSVSGSWAEFDISSRCYRAGWGMAVTGNAAFSENIGISTTRDFNEEGYGWIRTKYGFESEQPQMELKRLCELAFLDWKTRWGETLPGNFEFNNVGYEVPSSGLPSIGRTLARVLKKVGTGSA